MALRARLAHQADAIERERRRLKTTNAGENSARRRFRDRIRLVPDKGANMSLGGCSYLALLQAPLVPNFAKRKSFRMQKGYWVSGLRVNRRELTTSVTLECSSVSEG